MPEYKLNDPKQKPSYAEDILGIAGFDFFISYRNSWQLIKSSKLVVNQKYSEIYCGISMFSKANSNTPVTFDKLIRKLGQYSTEFVFAAIV